MEKKWIYCPVCGNGTKLMEIKGDTCIEGGTLEIKCRHRGRDGRGEHIIQISGNCQTKVITESKSA